MGYSWAAKSLLDGSSFRSAILTVLVRGIDRVGCFEHLVWPSNDRCTHDSLVMSLVDRRDRIALAGSNWFPCWSLAYDGCLLVDDVYVTFSVRVLRVGSGPGRSLYWLVIG